MSYALILKYSKNIITFGRQFVNKQVSSSQSMPFIWRIFDNHDAHIKNKKHKENDKQRMYIH